MTTPTLEFVWLLPSLVSASAAPVELVQSGRGGADGGASPAPQDVERLVNLFVIVAALLGAFLLAVILFTFVRRRRTTPARMPGRANGGEIADAWSEAGRRIEPMSAPAARRGRKGESDGTDGDADDRDDDPDDKPHGGGDRDDQPRGGRGRRG